MSEVSANGLKLDSFSRRIILVSLFQHTRLTQQNWSDMRHPGSTHQFLTGTDEELKGDKAEDSVFIVAFGTEPTISSPWPDIRISPQTRVGPYRLPSQPTHDQRNCPNVKLTSRSRSKTSHPSRLLSWNLRTLRIQAFEPSEIISDLSVKHHESFSKSLAHGS